MSQYKHLSIEEKERSRSLLESGASIRETQIKVDSRTKLEKLPFSISYPTIDKSVHSRIIPNIVNISERPIGCIKRSRYGHFESDTVIGMRKTGLIGTHVERKSGFLVAFKLETKTDKEFSQATIEAFKMIPSKLKKALQ